MANATLLVVHGVDQGTRRELGTEAVDIGRGVVNDLRIVDTEVSRRHATIEFAAGAYVVTDRGSSNGTFVNGKPVRARRLHNGDRIQIGRSVLRFSEPDDDGSKLLAEQSIDIVGRRGPDDPSSIVDDIVDSVGQDEGRTVAEEAGMTLLGRPEDGLATRQTLANLQALYRITEEAVSQSISLDQLLTRILKLTIDVSGADRGCILLRDEETGELSPHVFGHRDGAERTERMPVSRTIVDYVQQKGHGVRTSDAQRDRRFEAGQSIVSAGVREAMCVPMQGRYDLVGVVYVDITTPLENVLDEDLVADRFSEDQLRLLVAVGRQSALAVENNRYQQALLNAERLAAMGHTIAMLSHHIKNILQGVRGGSYLIDMGLNDHDEDLVRKGWGIVEKNQDKIYNLVMDMLTFSKERQPVLEPADLNNTVGEVCELMAARAEERDVRLELRPGADLPETTFDAEGVHRAILNIVTNAIDAAEDVEGGAVLIETGWRADDDVVWVSVTDNGPGIPDGQLASIFNFFESTKGARGTGLGLAVSRKIIREHGGEIRVESREGKGCRFTLTWPSQDDEHASPVADSGTQA